MGLDQYIKGGKFYTAKDMYAAIGFKVYPDYNAKMGDSDDLGNDKLIDICDLRKANAIQQYWCEKLWGGEHRNCEVGIITPEQMEEFTDTLEEVLRAVKPAVEKATNLSLFRELWESDEWYDALCDAELKLSKKTLAMLEQKMPAVSGFFYGEAKWDAWQIGQAAECLKAIYDFQEQHNIGDDDYVVYTYSCWY